MDYTEDQILEFFILVNDRDYIGACRLIQGIYRIDIRLTKRQASQLIRKHPELMDIETPNCFNWLRQS